MELTNYIGYKTFTRELRDLLMTSFKRDEMDLSEIEKVFSYLLDSTYDISDIPHLFKITLEKARIFVKDLEKRFDLNDPKVASLYSTLRLYLRLYGTKPFDNDFSSFF